MNLFRKIYNVQLDFLPIGEIRKLQFRKLRETIEYAYEKSGFYKGMFRKLKMTPEDIKTIEDIQRIPITTKDDLREKNFDFVAVSRDNWVDCFATSGTTGKPIYLPCTKEDLKRIANLTAKTFQIAGVKKEDKVQFTLPIGIGMWIAGLAFWLGNLINETCTFRIGPGNIDAQIQNMLLLKPTILLGTPSFLINLGNLARNNKYFYEIRPRLLLITAENILTGDLKRNLLGKRLVETWDGVAVRSGFGSNEMEAVGFECEAEVGHHIPAESIFFEIVEPKTHKVLKEGEEGMLVITHLGVKGLPLIRYAQGDVTFKIIEKCKCGRTTPRIGPILGRIDQQLKIKGVNIYPSAVEDVISGIPEINQYYLEAYTDENLMNRLRIYFSVAESSLSINKLTILIKEKIRSILGINVEVIYEKPEVILQKSMLPGSRKPSKFRDLRRRG